MMNRLEKITEFTGFEWTFQLETRRKKKVPNNLMYKHSQILFFFLLFLPIRFIFLCIRSLRKGNKVREKNLKLICPSRTLANILFLDSLCVCFVLAQVNLGPQKKHSKNFSTFCQFILLQDPGTWIRTRMIHLHSSISRGAGTSTANTVISGERAKNPWYPSLFFILSNLRDLFTYMRRIESMESAFPPRPNTNLAGTKLRSLQLNRLMSALLESCSKNSGCLQLNSSSSFASRTVRFCLVVLNDESIDCQSICLSSFFRSNGLRWSDLRMIVQRRLESSI